ncbi:MAG: hypothetical protein IPJ41_18540 [Phycisphaerales bacterium]|nr:hypothetical protein [Phycisphaerales bacterium]
MLPAWPISLVVAWRPFLDPLNLHAWWWMLLVPLSFGIAVTYRATRVATFEGFWLKAVILTVQIVLSMFLLGIASYLFIQVAVPYLMPMPG